MRSIGFRAEKAMLHFVAVDGTPECPILHAEDKIALQQTCSEAEALALLRTQLVSIVDSYHPDVVIVRTSDRPQGKAHIMSMFARARVEGVVLESCSSLGINTISAGSPTIKSGMKTKTPLRDYVSGDDVRGIKLSSKNKHLKEALIASISGLGR